MYGYYKSYIKLNIDTHKSSRDQSQVFHQGNNEMIKYICDVLACGRKII
jgi:hypothetical protein